MGIKGSKEAVAGGGLVGFGGTGVRQTPMLFMNA